MMSCSICGKPDTGDEVFHFKWNFLGGQNYPMKAYCPKCYHEQKDAYRRATLRVPDTEERANELRDVLMSMAPTSKEMIV